MIPAVTIVNRRHAARVSMAAAAALCVVMIGFNSYTRIREFSPDSMSYVDVARNFAAGRGLSQSALGFGRAEFTPDDPIPSPWTGHAPGFSVLLAAAATASGLSFESAILLLPVVFLGLLLLVAFLLARESYGEAIAWLTVAALLNYYPLRHVSAVAWSETTTMFFAFGALWLIARDYRRGGGAMSAATIGISAGLAFAVRYPMGVVIAVAGLALVTRRSGAIARDLGWFGAGLLCTAGPVLMRNLLLTGTLAGAASNPYRTPILTNLANTMWALSEYYQPYYLETPPRRLELAILAVAIAVVLAALAVQRRPGVLAEVFLRAHGPRWFTLWTVAYLAFLIVARSLTWFDPIDHRLIVPAGVGIVMLLVALGARTLRAGDTALLAAAAALLVAALGREAWFAHARSPVPRGIPETPRLQWVAANTTERDLIVGDYTMDLPFFFGRRRAITFEHYPYTKHLTYEGLEAYLRRHCHEYDHAYLIVRKWFRGNRSQWDAAFGPLVADLVLGSGDRYPDYRPLAKLSDSYVFTIDMPPCR
jgi:Dolichyl-phosphate-mannose-protein mannosyltransferase